MNEDAEDLREAVGRFVRTFRTRSGLPAAQAAVLGHLARVTKQSINDLALLEGVRHQSMARTVKTLEEAGMVSSTVDQNDRRKVVVESSNLGMAALIASREERTTHITRAILEALREDEYDAVASAGALLRRLSDAG